MIHRVIKLQDEDAAAIMTPRTDMVCIPADCTLEEARQRLLEAGHSRVPVIGKSPDDILGILYAKDLLKYTRAATDGTKLTEITRSPFYIPETACLDTLLETMKRQRVHMAIILDEYGGVSGLVTLEDILEEIVGEIVDEYDAALVEPVKYVSPHVAEVDARMHIDDVNREFQLQLPEDGDYDTIGGFVFSHLGRVPVEGETFTWQQAKFTVLDADKRRIRKLRIEVDESLTAVAGDE
ncbi:MAG: HlyC/CorC family transporter [Planctomycetes bacterium]|nr:HlyC/CorC family transporter [Planctomycetota bacterium]